jgi:hypothetical protein
MIGAVLLLMVAGAVGSACSASDGDSGSPGTAPLGFGVTDEAALVELLVAGGLSDQKASCVASGAFAGDPLTTLFAGDASLDISQARLDDAGRDCEVDWSDFELRDR